MTIPFPEKKYSVILADPAWSYNARIIHENRKTKFGSGAMGHYQTMTTKDISAMPVRDICEKDCALFMWATGPQLPEQIGVLKAWGFRYVTIAFAWMKTNKKTASSMFLTHKDLFFGVGYYTKSNVELCLLGIKGKMKPVSNKVSNSLLYPIGPHSKKPDIIRDKIVSLFGDVPRIELFARQTVPGWDCWGNQV